MSTHPSRDGAAAGDNPQSQSQSQSQPRSRGQNPVQVYHDCIVGNPRICNNCFRRYKDVEDPPDDQYWREHSVRTCNGHSQDRTLKHIVTRKTIRATTDGVVANGHVYTDWRNEPETRARPAWICKACGVIDGTARQAARERTAFLTAAERLYDRLCELGVACDEQAFFETARTAKADPDVAAKDVRLYEMAVDAGLTAASDTATETETTTGADAA